MNNKTPSLASSTDSGAMKSMRNVGEWLALASVVLAILGMFVSSPRFAGPDENAHQATAWFTVENGLPPTGEIQTPVPTIIPPQPCFAFYPEQDTACLGPRLSEGLNDVRTLNYPPIYYWVTGAGQKIASFLSPIWLDLGGRGSSLVLNLAGLIALAFLARRITNNWGTYLLLVTTPMAAFLWAVVNPSGWEITTALLFTVSFARAWWARGRYSLALLAVSSLLFGASRHDAMVWLILLVIAVLLMGGSKLTARERVNTILAAAPGVAFGIVWQLTHPAQHPLWNPYPVENPGPLDYISWLGQIDNALADRVRQMVGVLGWMDTPMPQWMMFGILVSWAALIGVMYSRARIPALVLAFGFVVSVILPSVIEVMRWNDWPYWYQGRITLPFTLAFLFALLLRFGKKSEKPAIALSLLMSLVLIFMVWQNLIRNAFGIKAYLPSRWSDPVLEPPLYWASWAIILILIVVTLARLIVLIRMNRDHQTLGARTNRGESGLAEKSANEPST